MDGGNDNDSDRAVGTLHQNLTSASSALQGLLRKLGAGLDDLLPSSRMETSSSHQHGRLKKILSGLRADGEEGKQVEALTQLCEMLSIGTEDSLSTFSVDSFVPILVGLLNHESNADIMLLAARVLTHLCDVLPSSCAVVVHHGAVACFCARLFTIEYMDLAEQSLQALKKISEEHPAACYERVRLWPCHRILFFSPQESRREYFYSTTFGLSRALHRLQQQQGADGNGSTSGREVRVGILQRQKVRVSRNHILDFAAKVMEMYSSKKAVLEVEYFGEVGTGLGPTLEFYTLLSHDLQKVSLRMWRSSTQLDKMEVDLDEQKSRSGDPGDAKKFEQDNATGGSDLVQAPHGLFPRPWPLNSDASDGSQFSKVVDYFRLVGRVMAKALQDGRLLDMPLSTPFYKLVLGQRLQEDFTRIASSYLPETTSEGVGGDGGIAVTDLRFRGTPIEDLCLDFTVPGYPDYILKNRERKCGYY